MEKRLIKKKLFFLPAGLSLFLSSCALLAVTAALPLGTVESGLGLLMKGAEVEKAMRKADYREAYNLPFSETWKRVGDALVKLQIPIEKAGLNKDGDAAAVHAFLDKKKITIGVVKLTGAVSEVGIWTKHDLALARLIAEEIGGKEKSARDSHLFIVSSTPPGRTSRGDR